MHSVTDLEKQQIGLRLPKYLIDEIDSFTREFSVNRTDIVTEALRAYLSEQKSRLFYEQFDRACKEAKTISEKRDTAPILGELIHELDVSKSDPENIDEKILLKIITANGLS